MKLRKLSGTLLREAQLALDLLGGEFRQVLVDDVSDVLEVDGERDDLHRTPAILFVQPLARHFCHVELDRSIELVDGVVHARDLSHQLPIVRHQRNDALA